MRYLTNIVQEYKNKFLQKVSFDDSLCGEISKIQNALLDDKFLPSVQLKNIFAKLLRRSKYPMEVAIVGQFSSGKSTFLNALLSKDILPTGITPVTSKVNYLNYGEEYKLKARYNNGINEYHSLESISSFTDQRDILQDVRYLTLYAPLEILKEISFVDTPGLNSQSVEDTQTTKKVLRDVDGIIWLTLLDNAGKESEEEVLKEYLNNFKEKSLCVLNQKDKFTKAQVDTTLKYIKENFSDYFSHVIPISAQQALDARVNQKNVLIDNKLHEVQKKFLKLSQENKYAKDISFFKDEFEKFSKSVEKIEKVDYSNDKKMMKESNISQVLEFIDKTLKPQATASKRYALKKDLSSICDILVDEYETILGVYESLQMILAKKENEILEAFDITYTKHSKALKIVFNQIESILQSVAYTIYENIKTKQTYYYAEEKGILFSSQHKRHDYESLSVDDESIMQKLFYDNQTLDKQVQTTLKSLKDIEMQSSEDFRDVFRILKHAIEAWQEPYELIKKNREIASDLEFANTRQFVSKVYENIILAYHRAFLDNIKELHGEFSFFSGAFSYLYLHSTKESIFIIKEQLDKQIELFEKNPTQNTLKIPTIDEIFEVVKRAFNFEKTENFLTSRRNYLYKTVEMSKEEFLKINKQQIEYVDAKKQVFINKITDIKQIQNSF